MIIYSSIILILLFCIIEYDIRGIRQYRERFIKLLLLILVCVSGLAYRLGGDGIGYFHEFKQYGNISDVSYNYLMGFQGRMPGWVLLCTLCKTITDSYWFFKIVHALILNVAYINVIKRNTPYVFTGILFYFVLIYFNQNFKLLREALAISFFFFSIPSFYEGKWLKYYIYILLAISFHEGALFLLLLPMIKLFGINKYSISFYIILGLLFIKYASSVLELIVGIQVDGEMQGKIFHYAKEIDTQYEFSFYGNVVLNIMLPLLIIVYSIKNHINIKYMYLVIMGIVIYLSSLVVPIFYRLSNYFLIFNYMLICDFVLFYILTKIRPIQFRLLYVFAILFPFLLFKGRMYLLSYGDTNLPSYVQYYPYASIIEKYEDPQRERLYKMME